MTEFIRKRVSYVRNDIFSGTIVALLLVPEAIFNIVEKYEAFN